MKCFKAHPGLVSLTTTIVVGSAALLIVLFLVLTSIDLVQQGLTDTEYAETFVAADSCLEEAMLRLNSDEDYSGDDYTIGSVDCTVSVAGAGSTRTLTVEASQGTQYVSRIQADVDLSTSPIHITNWEQI